MKKATKLDLISNEKFKEIIESSKSIKEALLKIGYKHTNKPKYDKIKKRINDEKISINHMLGHHLCGEIGIPLNEILIKNSKYTNNFRLKKRIVKEGVMKYKCIECGNDGVWLDKKLSLHLHHINGINNDNRLENLIFLCPNCHTQTETYCGKKSKLSKNDC